MCSLHLTHPSWVGPTWSSGQPTLWRSGSSWGFGALLKGLISVMDNSWTNLNPQPWVTSGFKSNALSIRPRLPQLGHDCPHAPCLSDFVCTLFGLLLVYLDYLSALPCWILFADRRPMLALGLLIALPRLCLFAV